MVVFEVVIVVMVQRITPPSSLGRVFGAINGASNTGKLIGALAAPALIALIGIEGSLIAIGAAVIVGAFVIGMLLTPPDIISQTMLALPMWVLFELGLIFSRGFVRSAEEQAETDAAEPVMASAGGAASRTPPSDPVGKDIDPAHAHIDPDRFVEFGLR